MDTDWEKVWDRVNWVRKRGQLRILQWSKNITEYIRLVGSQQTGIQWRDGGAIELIVGRNLTIVRAI